MPQRYSAEQARVQPGAPFGVLLTNLGTPDAPTAVAVRRYLAEDDDGPDPGVERVPILLDP